MPNNIGSTYLISKKKTSSSSRLFIYQNEELQFQNVGAFVWRSVLVVDDYFRSPFRQGRGFFRLDDRRDHHARLRRPSGIRRIHLFFNLLFLFLIRAFLLLVHRRQRRSRPTRVYRFGGSRGSGRRSQVYGCSHRWRPSCLRRRTGT